MNDDRLDRIDTKLDKVIDHLGSIDVTMVRNTVSLEEHMRRTSLLEAQFKPIEEHVSMIKGALKLIALVATLAATAEGVVALLEYIRH